ncbi:MAG: tetratricopeptide repeat protein [Actinomycetota bacterium]
MATKEALGRRLLRLRTERGLTQKEVAEPEYTASYISTIEAGRRKPSTQAIEHFARRLGLDPKEILTGQPKDLDVKLNLDLQRARMMVYEGDIEEAVAIAGQARREARRYAMREEEARAEVILGLAHRRAGDAARALEHDHKALDLLRDAPPSSRADAVVEVGRCHRLLGDIRYSIHVLESYLDEMKRAGLADPRALMLANAALVNSYFAAGLFPQAAAAGEQAQRLTPMVSDPHEVANLHISVAQVLTHQGFRGEALRSLQRAETIYESLDWGTLLAAAKLAKGIVLAANDEIRAARATLLEALDLFSRFPNATDKARTLNELARLERQHGDRDRALDLLREAHDLLEGSDVRERALCLLEMGLCEREKDASGAEKHMRAALDIYRRVEDPAGQAEALKALGDLLADQGDFRDAGGLYREGIEIASSAASPESISWAG